MPEEAHQTRHSDPTDMVGLDDFFPSHDKDGQKDLTLEEAAKRLNLSERTIQRRLKRGQLTGYKIDGDRGPEWRIKVQESVDMTLQRVSTSEDTTPNTQVMTDAVIVSSEDKTHDTKTSNAATFQHFANFYQDQIEGLQEKLEAATYRNGYLEAELTNAQTQLKLLPDFEARAVKAVILEQQVEHLERELKQQKRGWLARFGSWFIGKK